MPVQEAATKSRAMIETPDGLAKVLVDVGYGLVRARGCFGCHHIEGLEKEQPIGKELTEEGSQDLHKFDFGLLGHPYGDVEETRWNWIETKLRQPRIWEKGRFKPRWTDKLSMPKYNFRDIDPMHVV